MSKSFWENMNNTKPVGGESHGLLSSALGFAHLYHILCSSILPQMINYWNIYDDWPNKLLQISLTLKEGK
jgi:hypothetical protein